MNDERRFHLEINSLEAFAAFCALIRGEDLDDDKIRELTARLTKATAVLSAAEQADRKPK